MIVTEIIPLKYFQIKTKKAKLNSHPIDARNTLQMSL